MKPYEQIPTLPGNVPLNHSAIATPGPRQPLITIRIPTIAPHADEVLIRVHWVASTPVDLHQSDGGMLIESHPEVLGDGLAGTVVSVGWAVSHVQEGDAVFGFVWRPRMAKSQQSYATVPAWQVGKVPRNLAMEDAVTAPNNFVTVFNTVVGVLGLELPWPVPDRAVLQRNNKVGGAILIWGASSSVGMYTLQVLKRYGYDGRVVATASKKHHDALRGMGAKEVFDYRDEGVVEQVLHAGRAISGPDGPAMSYIVDCIGSVEGTLKPIAKVAEKGTKVAVMMPVIVRDAQEGEGGEPVYAGDVESVADWRDGVEAKGVRTHFYWMNELFKSKLQPEIMPAMFSDETVKPNPKRIIEGKTTLERAQKALDILRKREVSGERLVWKIDFDE